MSDDSNLSVPDAEARFVEELMVRYWDDALSDRELAALDAALAARPDLRAAFQEFSLQVLALSEGKAVEQQQAVRPVFARLRVLGRRRFLWSAAAAGVLAATGAAGLRWMTSNRRANPVMAHLSSIRGIVRIGSEAAVRFAAANQSLLAGEVVSTWGVDSFAEILCLDGSRLILGSNTSIAMPEEIENALRFYRGYIAADARPRPASQPLHIIAPEAEVRASNAKLTLADVDGKTSVGVFKSAEAAESGIVQFRRFSDNRLVHLHAGECIEVTGRAGDLRPTPLPLLPDTLEVAFGAGKPKGWSVGERVVEDLPPGSGAAVRAVPASGPLGVQYSMKSRNAWTEGMVEIHDDSWFHCRYRLDLPGFFQVFVVVRDPDPAQRIAAVFENKQLCTHCQPHQWHTLHVPLADFHIVELPARRMEKPLVAFQVVFDSQTVDRGLTIERFGFTRGS